MRCYNGCPDSALRKVLDARAAARKRLSDAGYQATYFPMEEKWMVFDEEFRLVTGCFNSVVEAADAMGV